MNWFNAAKSAGQWIGNAAKNTKRWIGSNKKTIKKVAGAIADNAGTIGGVVGAGVGVFNPAVGAGITAGSNALGMAAGKVRDNIDGFVKGMDRVEKVGNQIKDKLQRGKKIYRSTKSIKFR